MHLPMFDSYPGGEKRSRWHLQHGLTVFENYFGLRPYGCWPSEGGLSDASLQSIYDAGFKWVATGEAVLRNSLQHSDKSDESFAIYHAYRKRGSELRLFARDDALSDLIGFTYADWHADDAVADLIQRLESIAAKQDEKDEMLISIILDGENAWEYYPENAYHFLSALYHRLAVHPDLQLTTFAEALDKVPAREIQHVVSGSWVYGNFSTWIGDEDKNRAWDILADAKRVYDELSIRKTFEPDQHNKINKQLAACEGSDWFWWFGDYNPAEAVSDFESLFRLHLANLYHMLGEESPQYLSQTLDHGSGAPKLGGVIRPGVFSK
jgi:alpha-amylase/alpha-mannosidase (GH57 family)